MDWLVVQAEKVERYEKALKFYADRKNYTQMPDELFDLLPSDIDYDGGKIARNSLDG
jgi:hypothetical protein